jgi:hypothetical protein
MVVNFTCWAPFGLIQFYFLFSGREHAGIGGRNGAGIIINISIVLFNLVIIKFMIFRK